MQDRDTNRVYLLYDFSKALLIRRDVAYCVAGKVNSADKLYLVIESPRLDTKHSRVPTALVPADAAGGSPVRSSQVDSLKSVPLSADLHVGGQCTGLCRRANRPSLRRQTGETAALLYRRQQRRQ